MSGRRRDLARQVGEAVQLTALGVIASPVPTFQCKICLSNLPLPERVVFQVLFRSLLRTGTWCRIASHQQSTTKYGDIETTVINLAMEGQSRFTVEEFTQTSPYHVATIRLIEERDPEENSQDMSSNEVKDLFGELQRSMQDYLASTAGRQDRISIKSKRDKVHQVSQIHQISKNISDQVQQRSSEELRETVLRRQLLELNREMRKLRDDGRASDSESDEDVHGFADDEGEEDQVATLREALKKAQLSPEAEKIAQRELRRLQNIQPHHPEHSDHYGLEKVKRRILEFLAVQKMRKDMKGPILCLHGPPGVGKTSLGRSVAKALNRKFHRIALGGLRDEAEIRGHRRTYIGSMPGAIMQALATLQVNNPVILLDEIDKLTRNAIHVSPRLATVAPRLVVAVEHLPSILGAQVFEPDVSERLTVGVAMGLGVSATGGALLFVEASRSKGSGKLTVTGQLGEVMQESVRTAVPPGPSPDGSRALFAVWVGYLRSLLRSRIYYAAWGSERPRVESPLEPIRLSSDSILSKWARDEHKAQDPFGGDDIHVHFPAGAIPKDGPSAGVATVLALASLLLARCRCGAVEPVLQRMMGLLRGQDRPVRSDTAVTGEITLRGHILPVGGIRDKVLAAHRAGIRHVLVPFGNQRHVFDEIPEAALSDVEVKYVKHIDQALAWAFEEQQDRRQEDWPSSELDLPLGVCRDASLKATRRGGSRRTSDGQDYGILHI
eukprot:g27859.t1